MKCPKCENGRLENCGYGERGCNLCGYMERSDYRDDIMERMYGEKKQQNDNDLEEGWFVEIEGQ